MAHLNDKLAEFFYEELPASEMVEARRHVRECADCRGQLELFQRTHLALRELPDAELPRRVAFTPPDRQARWGILDWRFLAPMCAAAAALVLAVIPHFQPVPTAVMPVAPPPVVVQTQPQTTAPPQAIDYDRIARQVRESDRTWFVQQLEERDREIRQLQGQLAYYESYQRTVMRETLENASNIQLLAQRTASQD
jgi:hypothetical protein